MINKNISIITNWGCQQKCWFCIWQHHPLKDVCKSTNWKKLSKFISDNKEKGKFSISGGGDCLFEYDKHIKWWTKIFSLAEKHNMKIDVHTKQRFYDNLFWGKINRAVVSSEKLYLDKDYFLYLKNITNVRIVHVVTKDTTINDIEDYLYFCKKHRIQFTVKQLSIYDDEGNYNMLKKHYGEKLFGLDEGDYNIYYMPDNSITDKFI